MDGEAREALGRLLSGADAQPLRDARRIRELLQDACPQSRREVMLLVTAAEEGLPPRLRKLGDAGMVPAELNRLAADLTRARGLDPVLASWAVGAWAWALGLGPIPAQERDGAESAVAVSVPPPAGEPREALGRLLSGADAQLLGDARRVRALLQDASPQSRREVMLLVTAAEEGLPLRLRKLGDAGMVPAELNRLAAELTRARGLDPVLASWAVGAWAWALGLGPIPAQEQVAAASPQRTPVQGQAGLRPPQRPPASPPTPGVTEERERPRRRRTVPVVAAIAAAALLVGGIVFVAAGPGAPGPTTTIPTTSTRGPGPTTSTLLLPPHAVALFHDDFSSTSNDWSTGSLAAGSIRYLQGAYRFHGTKVIRTLMGYPGRFTPTEANPRLGIQVSGQRVAGEADVGYGVFCRFTGKPQDLRSQTFYEMQVLDSGVFVIQKYVHGAYRTLRGPAKDPAIRTGQVNRVRGECTGGQNGQPVMLSLWANDHLLGQAADRSEPLPARGKVGVLTATYNHVPVDVVFDDFLVYAT
jgi:hypothetical protein